MRVILLKNVKGLGKIFDVKSVSDGYARNFLLPKGLAKLADEQSLKHLELQKTALRSRGEKTIEELKNLASKLAGQEFRFYLKTGGWERAFGSINREEIKRAVAPVVGDCDFLINLERPIKTFGEHEAEIELFNPVEARGLIEQTRRVKTKIKILILER